MFRKQKKEQPTFDQNSIDIALQHGQHQLQQLRVIYKWKEEKFEGRLPTLTCQWFNKSPHSMELIEGVTEDTYQPSILDVGTTIYIQMMPFSSQMEYIGMPITKFVGPLVLSAQTEQQVKDMLQAQKSTYFVEINSIKLNNQSMKGEVSKVKQALLKVVRHKVMLYAKFEHSQKSEVLKEMEVGKQFPQLTIDRKNSKLITVDFGQGETAQLQLQNHRIRDVLYLLIDRIRQKVNLNASYCEESELAQEQQTSPHTSNPKEQDKSASKAQPILQYDSKQTSQEEISKGSHEQNSTKTEESLPKSPQTTQPPKQPKQEEQSLLKLHQIARQSQQKINELTETNSTLNINLRSLAAEKQHFEEQAYYFRNQCCVQKQAIAELQTHIDSLSQQIKQKQLETQLRLPQSEAELIYGNYLSFNRQQLLNCIVQLVAEVKAERCKTEYQLQRAEQLQSQIKQLSNQIEEHQLIIKKMQKKIESLVDKSVMGEYQPQQHTYSHQLGSYQFEISKLKQQLNLLASSKHNQAEQKDRIINSLKLQVRELIEENSYYRSKDKSSKGELKNQIVELRKLVNRFGESIAEKDIEISHLKMTNREMSKNWQSAQK